MLGFLRRLLPGLSSAAGAPPPAYHPSQHFSWKFLLVGTFGALLIVSLTGSDATARSSRVTHPGHASCGWVREIGVCSHQLKGAASLDLVPGARQRHEQRVKVSRQMGGSYDEGGGGDEHEGHHGSGEWWPPVDGSLDAMEAMWVEGMTCFDVDVVALADGVLLAAHPGRLAAALAEEAGDGDAVVVDPSTLTLDAVRAAGASSVAFPLLEDVMRRFASIIQRYPPEDEPAPAPPAGGTVASDASRGAPVSTGPVLGLDLKGRALEANVVRGIMPLAVRLGIDENLLVYVWGTGEEDKGHDVFRMLREEYPRVPVGLGLRDREEVHWRLERLEDEALRGIAALVPSSKFDDEWFAAAVDSGRRVLAWVVDDEDALVRAVERRISAFITNDPGRMINSLRGLYRGCMGT